MYIEHIVSHQKSSENNLSYLYQYWGATGELSASLKITSTGYF